MVPPPLSTVTSACNNFGAINLEDMSAFLMEGEGGLFFFSVYIMPAPMGLESGFCSLEV